MLVPNGSAIRAIREVSGWKAVRLAEAVGISRSHLASIEHPTRQRNASVEVLRKIADTLGVDLADITSNHPGVAAGNRPGSKCAA